MCVNICAPYACMQGWMWQKTAPDPMELELQVVVNCLISVLGTKPWLHSLNPHLPGADKKLTAIWG